MSGLGRRLDDLEALATDRSVRQAANVLAREVDAPAHELIARAEAIADLVALVGRDQAVEIIAERSGTTADQLKSSAARLRRLIT